MKLLDEDGLQQLGNIISGLYRRIEAQGNRSRQGSDLALLGAILQTVKLALGNRGGYEQFIEQNLEFTPRTARRLLKRGDEWLKAKLFSDGIKAQIKRLKAKQQEEDEESQRWIEQFAKENPHIKSLWPFRKD